MNSGHSYLITTVLLALLIFQTFIRPCTFQTRQKLHQPSNHVKCNVRIFPWCSSTYEFVCSTYGGVGAPSGTPHMMRRAAVAHSSWLVADHRICAATAAARWQWRPLCRPNDIRTCGSAAGHFSQVSTGSVHHMMLGRRFPSNLGKILDCLFIDIYIKLGKS